MILHGNHLFNGRGRGGGGGGRGAGGGGTREDRFVVCEISVVAECDGSSVNAANWMIVVFVCLFVCCCFYN